MTTATLRRTRRVALIGNPNTGKTTIFNALTGFRGRVGNYAGVTVERKEGPLAGCPDPVVVVDLPGTYSLAARSADEMVAVDILLGDASGEDRPTCVVVVLDASNLERNLFLGTQLLEVGVPVLFALNMMDEAEKNGIRVDPERLGKAFGVRVFPLVAARKQGLPALSDWLSQQADLDIPPEPDFLPDDVKKEILSLEGGLQQLQIPPHLARPFLMKRVLLEVGGMAETRLVEAGGEAARALIQETRQRVEAAGHRLKTLEARLRYGWIRHRLEGVVERDTSPRVRQSDRIDAVLTHRVWGTLVFAALMVLVFQAIYGWSAPLMDGISALFDGVKARVGAALPEGPLNSFLTDGVIGGVGGVLVFLPQICILFAFIAILEDSGYMARAAFLMDRLLSRCGLSGRSFIPMLSSFACAVPGIMATRTIEDRRDRLATILVAPLMSCSARLPVYALLIGTFVPNVRLAGGLLGLQGLVLMAMYVLGLAVAIPVALILKRTLLKGSAPAFVMELPPYKVPNLPTVLHRMWERARAFITLAGTLILAISVVVWAATYYPHPESIAREREAAWVAQADQSEAARAAFDGETSGIYLRQSVLGRMGRVIEPAVRPLGWDWRIAMAVLASFPAREVVVATLGIVYDVGSSADENSADLRARLSAATWPDGRRVFTLPVALSIMVFFALCMQCASTLATMRRETNGWRWPAFAFVYMTGLAYVGALLAYQLASRLL